MDFDPGWIPPSPGELLMQELLRESDYEAAADLSSDEALEAWVNARTDETLSEWAYRVRGQFT